MHCKNDIKTHTHDTLYTSIASSSSNMDTTHISVFLIKNCLLTVKTCERIKAIT